VTAPGSAARAGLPPLPGFIVSAFSPLVAHVAEQVLRREYGAPPADPTRAARTATVLVSRYGDVTSAVQVARAVDAATRVAPLLFYQAVPNAVAGYLAARWGLCGPVVCLSPLGDPMTEGLAVAVDLFDDRDADEALIVAADQDTLHSGPDDPDGCDTARAVLLDGRGHPAHEPQPHEPQPDEARPDGAERRGTRPDGAWQGGARRDGVRP
jgi:hypothetical protein